MRIALLQCDPPVPATAAAVATDRLALLAEKAHEASQFGADLLVTPECYLSGYHIGLPATRDAALTSDSTTLSAVREVAASASIALVVGYISTDGAAIRNTITCWSANGDVLSSYHKTHLFGETDRSRFEAGQSRSDIVEIAGVRIAMGICFDIEFPELARAYADDGAQLIVVPTASMAPYDSIPLRLVPTRAEENGLFVAYANYSGRESEFEYTGLSCVCGPDGHDLARAARDPELVVARLDLCAMKSVRGTINYLQERRNGVYQPGGKN